MILTALPLTLALAAAQPSASAPISPDRVERIRFGRGASAATVRGRIRGYQLVDYIVNARAGQRLTVRFGERGRFTYFVVRAPGSEDNLFDGSTSGNQARLTLAAAGDYRIRVFQMRNAARRGEASNYSLSVRVEN